VPEPVRPYYRKKCLVT